MTDATHENIKLRLRLRLRMRLQCYSGCERMHDIRVANCLHTDNDGFDRKTLRVSVWVWRSVVDDDDASITVSAIAQSDTDDDTHTQLLF